MSTSLLYALEMGIDSFIYSLEEPKLQNKSGEIYGMSDTELEEYINAHLDIYRKVLPVYPNIKTSEENMRIIRNIMGLDKQSPREEIRNALLEQKTKNILKGIISPIYEDISDNSKFRCKLFSSLVISKNKKTN